MVCCLSDDGGVHKVIEKLEGTDAAIDDRFAMRTRRKPEPVLNELKGPTGRWTGGSCGPVRRLGWHELWDGASRHLTCPAADQRPVWVWRPSQLTGRRAPFCHTPTAPR